MRVLLPLVLLVGCLPSTKDVDTDGDGLTDADEEERGTDPAVADSDADGLEDGNEVDIGTDPMAQDTDGDSYLDAWEVTEGTDPTDDASVIYTGGWPYNPEKDGIEDPTFDARGHTKVGKVVPRFAWTDQFGEEVDIYDFAGHGKPVVIDLSGAWCYWCQQVAKLMEGRRNDLDAYYDDTLSEMLADGDFYWVTILDSDVNGTSIDPDEVAEWYDTYTNEYVPVLADENQDFTGWVAPVGYPTAMLVDENMEVVVYDEQDYTAVFDALLSGDYTSAE